MPEPIPLALRHQIVSRHLKGQPLSTIAREIGRSESGVRKIFERYKRGGFEALKPDYHNCGPQTHRSDPLIVRAACWLKRRHPDWGAPYIQMRLAERYGQQRLPTPRTLQRWFKDKGLQVPRRRAPQQNRSRAERVHETWQIDANERLRLDDGSGVCYLSVADEKSGSLLSAGVFPPQPDRSGHTDDDAYAPRGAL